LPDNNPAPLPILYMVRELGPGGTERQMTEMARAVDRRRFQPHVGYFRPGMRMAELQADGIPLLHLPVTSFASPGVATGALQLARYLRHHRIAIVHTFDAPMNSFAVPVARAAGVPLVLSSQRGRRDYFNMPRLLRLSDRLAHGIVVNCQYMRRHLIEDEHVPDSKIHLCYNGLDCRRFQPPAQPDPNRPFTIGVVCLLRPEKDLPTLLRAFLQVRHLLPAMRLLLVGSGSEEKALQQMAQDLGLGDQCQFQPAARDVVPWLHQIDIFVLPSRDEAFSNSIMEAMGCGCAIVASDAGGNPELIQHEISGLLFPAGDEKQLADRLAQLIRQESWRRQLAAAGLKRVREVFSIEASAQRAEAIYLSMLRPLAGQPDQLR